MNNFDFESKKINIIIFIIFIGFALLIIKAFDYLPQNSDDNGSTNVMNIEKTKPVQPSEETAQNTVNEKQIVEPQNDKNDFQVDLSKDITPVREEVKPEENLEPIREVIEPAQTTNVVSDNDVKFLNIQKLKDGKQYAKAIEEYNAIANSTSDTQLKARCYEEIANVYAVLKRYGSAISYAQKAYNIYPTSAREMLLARLYYKTGDLDKATKRMNNVLQRDFANDRN